MLSSRYHSPGLVEELERVLEVVAVLGEPAELPAQVRERPREEDGALGALDLESGGAARRRRRGEADGAVPPPGHDVHLDLREVVPARDLRARHLNVLVGVVGAGQSVERERAVRSEVRGPRADRLDAVDVELPERRGDPAGGVDAVARGGPAGDGRSARDDRLLARVGEVLDVVTVLPGVRVGERQRAGLLIRAAAQVDRDVGRHAGGHAAHDVARLAHGPQRLRHGSRVRVVAGRRDIEGPAGHPTAAARGPAGSGRAAAPDRTTSRARATAAGGASGSARARVACRAARTTRPASARDAPRSRAASARMAPGGRTAGAGDAARTRAARARARATRARATAAWRAT